MKYLCDLNNLFQGHGTEERRGEVGCVLTLSENLGNNEKI